MMNMLDKLKLAPVVPVFYHADASYAQEILSACYAGGLRFFEFTNRGKDALEVFSSLAAFARLHCPELSLGIGTIYAAETAVLFMEAGAQFVVQPVCSSEVGELCRSHGVPWIPGAFTPQEIWNAWQSGASLVKLFPGNLLSPDYIRALRGPMPDIPFMVTGGVEPDVQSVKAWLDAGAQAVGIGSQLFKGDYSSNFEALVQRIAALKNELVHT